MALVNDAPLQQVIAAIQQRWGPDALRPLGEFPAQRIPLPTGFVALDTLCGGWPCGRLTLVTGGPSAGLSTLGFHALAAAQREELPTLIIDGGGALDPASMARCGVDLEQVLLVRPAAGSLGLEIVRDVVAAGGGGIMLFAAGLPVGRSLCDRTRVTQALRHLSAALPRTRWVVLCLASPSDTFTRMAAPYAEVRLQVEREAWQREGRDITGCTARATLRQHPTRPPGPSVTLSLSFSLPLSDEP